MSKPLFGLLVICGMVFSFIPLNNYIYNINNTFSNYIQIIFPTLWVASIFLIGYKSLKEVWK